MKAKSANRTPKTVTPKTPRKRALRELPPPLVQPRAATCAQLAASLDKIRRIEKAGYLKRLRYSKSENAPVFHACDEVRLLVDKLKRGEVVLDL